MIAPEPLSTDAIRRRLGAATLARHLYVFADVESTNTVTRNLAKVGAQEGTVVLAEAQTQGRGRLGQEWFSPSGVNLYCSVLFRPSFHAREAPRFSFIASLAVVDAVKELGLDAAIKWPNDVLVQHKKVAGSLVECATRDEGIEYLVLGVGVNVNVDLGTLRQALGAAGMAATSLAAALGHEVDRNAFAASYLNLLDGWARRYRAEGPGPILAAWRDHDILTGRRVEVRGDGATFDGRVLGVDDDGHLVVQDPARRRHTILTEEIRIVE
jgi:BirA family biotin operon repressor/biotin-[acetyl-CoA-carboxylase] ligase